ncbi:GTPase IMAP family member 9-like, partial [Engraulis encrasicolus]|uniref:GTPase IMAP family member 9-like n=1 Tax=Engraulis encrasicolus TaxID=184585 RepID=UPI002FD10E1D
CSLLEPDLRIVLVGKTDAGKSSTGNTICGRRVFVTKSSDRDTNFRCIEVNIHFGGQLLSVVDTPGLFGPNKSNEEVKRQIANGVALSAPGPHVLLVVFQLGKFTNEEKETVNIIQRMLGKEAACYTMALFTHGDELKQGRSIEEFIDESPDLCAFIHQCGGGYHVFNNRDEDPSQIRELLEKINTMVQRNGGRYYAKDLKKRFHEDQYLIRITFFIVMLLILLVLVQLLPLSLMLRR